jgi:glycosyltransferase involved in cell wall biosynthesis
VKALDVLVRAWALLVGTHPALRRRLVLIGEGGERARLERLVRETDLSASVQFLGALPQAAVAEWLAASDLLCLPSHAEGSPNVIVEALASGVPVVASRVGGIPDLVQDGVTGLLTAPGDAPALARALAAALERRWDPLALVRSVSGLTWPALAARNEELLACVAAETP